MVDPHRLREEDALAWVRRLHDPDFHDWDAHLAWLAADPANGAAFDRLLLLVEEETAGLAPAAAGPAMPPPLPANDNADVLVEHAGKGRRRWIWMSAAAASVAAVVGVTTLPRSPHPATTSIALRTAPGEHRSVLLADGTQVAMNGDTALRVEGARGRRVEIEHGQAFFTVTPDPDTPFRVRAGDVVLQDVGTAFDVTNAAGAVDVAVREGVVLYDPEDLAVRLTAGRSLHVADNAATERTVEARSVGGWRSGRLTYRDETLDRVARDVTRSTGVGVRVDTDVADRRFTGVVMIGGDRSAMLRRLAAVTGTSVMRSGTGWRISSRDR